MTKQRLMRRLFNCRVLTLLALLGLVVSPAMKGKTENCSSISSLSSR